MHFVGGDLTEAVNEGVRRGCDKGYLEKVLLTGTIGDTSRDAGHKRTCEGMVVGLHRGEKIPFS